MSTYTKRVEQYRYTETLIYKDEVVIFRDDNLDASWYGTQSIKEITEEEAEDYL